MYKAVKYSNYNANTVLCIDPGTAGTGLALFKANDFNMNVYSYGSTNSNDKTTMEKPEFAPIMTIICKFDTVEEYLAVIHNLIMTESVVQVYCEGQAYMKGSIKGQVTADSGALVKLSNFAGSILGLCFAMKVPFRWVTVNAWKGQLPKQVVWHRINQAIPGIEEVCKSHAMDAVGIGLWLQGIINK
jgi:hypothetical protein